MGQVKSLEWHLQKDDTLRKRYHETIDTDIKAVYVCKVQQVELNETRDRLQWYVPHHPAINPHWPEKVRRVCNAAAKYQGVARNEKFLSGPELLQSLIGIIFCFREHQISFSADIEARFLQVAVPSDGSQPMLTIFLARRSSAEARTLRVYTTRFGGKELADLCQLRFASSGKRERERRQKFSQNCPSKLLHKQLPQVSQNTPRSNRNLSKCQISP